MPVKIVSPVMKRLLHEKELLDREFFRLADQTEALRNKIEGIEIAIAIIEKGDTQDAEKPSRPTTNIKGLLIELAREAGAAGINANTAVKMAEKKGIRLLRGSAASNLSRLKADNALVHDGKKYRLPEFMRPQLQLAVGGKGS